MTSPSNPLRIVRYFVMILACAAIGAGFTALNTASASTDKAVGRVSMCCCSNQCVRAVNGHCPTNGCQGPFIGCPLTCGTAL